MARDVETQNYLANREVLMNNWQPQVAAVSDPIQSSVLLQTIPTQEAVVSKAQFLGEFINNSDKKIV
jgi:hypothetical protein